MKNHLNISIIAIFGLFLLMNSCEHKPKELIKPNSKGNDTIVINPEPVSDCDSSIAYFKNDIMPIIASNCLGSGCHNAADSAGEIVLTTYQKVRRLANTKKPENSKLWEVLNATQRGDMMPRDKPLSDTLRYKIWKWLSQGAKNDSCNSGCDSTKYAYADIKPIITANCIGCHTIGSSTATQIGSYTDLYKQYQNGNLKIDIESPSGNRKMPRYTNLSVCDKKKILKWIAAGGPQ